MNTTTNNNGIECATPTHHIERDNLQQLIHDSSTKKTTTPPPFNLSKEASLLLNIALPSVAVQFSVLLIFPQTASIVGRQLGTQDLAGFSLASLTGNLTCLSVLVGALTAADTLMPRAFGTGNHEEMGRLAIRGLVMCIVLLIPPILPLIFSMDFIFDKLGQDPIASKLASVWIRVYLLGVPSQLVFRVVQSFLNAQNLVWPLVFASLISCFVVHPVLLRAIVPVMGFVGSGIAVTITNTVMVILLLLYLKFTPNVYHVKTWPGLSWGLLREAVQFEPMMRFLSLSVGGVLSLSEWWFWETVCFIAGSFGVVPLCVHSIAYNLVPLLFMIPLGIMIGLQVRMGMVLPTDVPKAKLLAKYTMAFTVILAAVICLFLYRLRVPIVSLFTNDQDVLDGCEDIWFKVCIDIFVLYTFGINSAIMRALGMQWQMAGIIFICLWLGALPTIIIVSMRHDQGVDSIWTILPIFYSILSFLLFLSYATVDWQVISDGIRRERARMEEKHIDGDDDDAVIVSESTSLLETPVSPLQTRAKYGL